MELSNLFVYGRPIPNSGLLPTRLVVDWSDYIWPSYRRVTLARGGDGTASATLKESTRVLERWFQELLGCHVEERWQSQPAFMGRILTMRYSARGMLLIHDLSTVFNRVACAYTSVVTGNSAITSFYEDASSQGKWGKRTIILRPSDQMAQSEAEEYAQYVLALSAEPKIQRHRLDSRVGADALKVQIQGYTGALADVTHHSSSKSTVSADVALTDALANSDMVTAGGIATNTRQITEECDNRKALDRIKYIASRGGASDAVYRWGCFASHAFDYLPMDTTNIRYTIRRKEGRNLHYEQGNYVPAPLVQPSGISFVADYLNAQPRRLPILTDVRAQLDEAVEYSARGAVLRAANWGQEQAHIAEMNILGDL